jgi:hypothetical protein
LEPFPVLIRFAGMKKAELPGEKDRPRLFSTGYTANGNPG